MYPMHTTVARVSLPGEKAWEKAEKRVRVFVGRLSCTHLVRSNPDDKQQIYVTHTKPSPSPQSHPQPRAGSSHVGDFQTMVDSRARPITHRNLPRLSASLSTPSPGS